MINLQLIKTLAKNQGVALKAIADEVGISEQQMHLLIRKNTTKIDTLARIASVLGVPVSAFFEEERIEINHADRDLYNRNEIHQIVNQPSPEGSAAPMSAADGTDDDEPDTDDVPTLKQRISKLKAEKSELQAKLIKAQSKIISLLDTD